MDLCNIKLHNENLSLNKQTNKQKLTKTPALDEDPLEVLVQEKEILEDLGVYCQSSLPYELNFRSVNKPILFKKVDGI